MTNDFGASNLFTINHTTAFFVPNLESLGLASYNPNQKADFNIYVRCMDKSGNKNVAEYVVNFCIKPGADLTPPTVVAKEPANNWLKWNAENVTTSLFVNEPSECKWDLTDKTYNLMSKNFSCNTDYDSLEFNGFRCTATLPVMNSTIKAFVRCKDQPWLVEANGTESAYIKIENGPTDAEIANAPVDTNEAGIIDAGYTRINVSNDRKRNSMTESYVLEYTRSASKLNIDYLKPNNETISSGISPFSVNFEAATSGGANGEATCKYKMNGLWIEFFETFGTIHRQSFQGFTAGPKLIEVMCEDIAGNDALMNASFTLDIDKTVPSVTRVYAQGSTLNVITDEKAECRYKDSVELGQEPCAYEYTNGTLMSGMEKVHSLSLEGDKTYYIKCKDIFDNTQSDCSLIVSGSRFYSATQVL
jgi:hypothetical protein